VVEWTKLTYGMYKCNIDASFSPSLNMVGIGICLRDDLGEFVLAKKYCFSPTCDVDVGEAVGLYTMLKWMEDFHYDNVDFALDSKTFVDHFTSNIKDNSELGCIIHVCRQLFDNSFQNSNVELMYRHVFVF
jgi:hypothetical protein